MAVAGSLTYEFKATTAGLQAGLRTAQEEMARLNNHVKRSVEEFQRMGAQAQRAVGLTRSELVNLSRQIQDVGVSLASGQSPFMVMIQQGAQIQDIFSSSGAGAGAALRGFAGQLTSIVTPARVMATAGVAAFAGMTAAALSAVNAAASLTETVKVLGTSFQGLRGLNQRGEVFGLDAKTMNSELVGLAQKLSEAAREGGQLAKFMQANGIKDANGQARPFREVFADIARLIGSSGTELDKLNALKLLGLSSEFKRVFEEAGADVERFATGTRGTIDAWGEETRRRFEDLKLGLLKIWSDLSVGVINYLSEIKFWALQVAEAISAAFSDVMRGIEAAIAGGKRLLGQASEAVGLGGRVGTSDFEYRQEALQIGRKRILDMRAAAASEGNQTVGPTKFPDISVGGGIAFPSSKTAKAHKEAQDAVKNYIESLRIAEETAKAEVENWRLGNVEREKAVALAKAEEVARKEGRALTDAERASIEERAASTGRHKDRLEELREAQQRLNQVTREFQYVVSNALEDIILRGGKAKDVLAAMAKEFASFGLRQGINSLFGDTQGKSQGGGLLGGLLGLFGGGSSGKGLFSGSPFKLNFGGFFADGGGLGAGKWGIAGENGPEIIHGPANVSPMGGGGVVVHNYAAGVEVTPRMTPQGVALIVQEVSGQMISANNRRQAEAPMRAHRR
jgi:hypothetical protein